MATELVFIPVPEIGHLVSMMELAKQITKLNDHINITILTPCASFTTKLIATQGCTTKNDNLRFVSLPEIKTPELLTASGMDYYPLLAQFLKPHVKDSITNIFHNNSPPNQFGGLVFDMLFTPMIDVAKELAVASYVYFPSSAAMLGFILHFPTFHAQRLDTHDEDPQTEFNIPSFVDPVPIQILPSFVLANDRKGCKTTLDQAKIYEETKGIIVNTSTEIESGILDLIASKEYPPIYPVGPLLDLGHTKSSPHDHGWTHYDFILKWLDDQPPMSVIFLCFGSRTAFSVSQVHEIAHGLELSGRRFVWVLRQPPSVAHDLPSDYRNPSDVLPDGFIDRTAGRGLVCGWAPQTVILARKAIGGFVSHCGWNSLLEGLWCGVPILAWPLYADQSLNSYRLVKELGVAVMVKENDHVDGIAMSGAYMNGGDLVTRDVVKKGVESVMDGDGEVRRKVEVMKHKLRGALTEGGPSFKWLKILVDEICSESIIQPATVQIY